MDDKLILTSATVKTLLPLMLGGMILTLNAIAADARPKIFEKESSQPEILKKKPIKPKIFQDPSPQVPNGEDSTPAITVESPIIKSPSSNQKTIAFKGIYIGQSKDDATAILKTLFNNAGLSPTPRVESPKLNSRKSGDWKFAKLLQGRVVVGPSSKACSTVQFGQVIQGNDNASCVTLLFHPCNDSVEKIIFGQKFITANHGLQFASDTPISTVAKTIAQQYNLSPLETSTITERYVSSYNYYGVSRIVKSVNYSYRDVTVGWNIPNPSQNISSIYFNKASQTMAMTGHTSKAVKTCLSPKLQ